MVYISSIGIAPPKHRFPQAYVKTLVQKIFQLPEEKISRLLPVFDHALVNERQLVVDEEWLQGDHTFAERNKLYQTNALTYSLKAMDHCLTNSTFLNTPFPYEAIDMICFVSSTGISTPTIDAYLMNERPFRNDVIRLPLWGLGCAGGAIGLARAFDWLKAHPDKNALIICCELCSLTFQKQDLKKSNLIGAALFGDGISCALLLGEQSPYINYHQGKKPVIQHASSYMKKQTLDLMGWHVTNSGFEVIFSKNIPALLDTIWQEHFRVFLLSLHKGVEDFDSFIVHPGGPKILTTLEKIGQIEPVKLRYSYQVLKDHGNMSSVTIFYVLYQWMLHHEELHQSLLTALGPGFSSELLYLEWVN